MYLFFLVSLNLCGYPNVEILYTSRKSNTFPIHAVQMEFKFVWLRWSSTWTCMFAASFTVFYNKKKQKTKERKIPTHNSPVLIILCHSCNYHHELINNNYQSCEFSRWILWMDFDPPPTLKLRLHPFCVTTVLFARPRIRCKLKFSQSY